MGTLIRRFFGTPDASNSRHDLRIDWSFLLAACLLAWLVNLTMRLIDLSAWAHPGLFVDGGHVMATHDAYFWLAGAEGVRPTFNSEMHTLLRGLSVLFGGDLVKAAFYGPVLLSGLVGVVGAFWGWLLAGRNGAWVAGLLAGVAPGFFRRTRLGYYDSDLMTLLMPLFTVFLLALLLSGVLRRSWLGGIGDEEDASLIPNELFFPAAFLCGLLVRPGWWFHQDIINFGVVSSLLAAALVLVAGRPGKRGEGLLALTVFMITAFLGSKLFPSHAKVIGAGGAFLGFGMSAALAFWGRRFWPEGKTPLLVGIFPLVFVCLVGRFLDGPASLIWSQLAPYLKPVADSAVSGTAAGVTPPTYPAVAQSIIEAKNMPLDAILMRLGPFYWLAPFGIIGLLWVVIKRPVAVLLLPLLGLGLASMKLGVRFTMFGGPAVAIGLAVPLVWAVDKYAGNRFPQSWFKPMVHISIGLLILTGLALQYKELPLTPSIDRPHGEALTALKAKAPTGSTVWTWWDYGYATQFYAGHTTPSDGGQHSGRYIYPTALALNTDSLQQAANIINYAAANNGDPSPEWDRMGAKAARAQVESLRTGQVPAPEQPQYLVIPWAGLKIVKWINFFGSWRLDTGASPEKFRFKHVTTPYRLEPNQGVFIPADGSSPMAVSSVDLLDGEGYKHHEFYQNVGAPHLVINKGQQDTYLMDDGLYNSTLVQLLVCDPADARIQEHFELAVEGAPHVRIYRVK